jgi:tetratricopeptide (TPR) repeat protein
MALGGFTAVIVKEITMTILMKVLISNIVGVLTVGLLGCGCLYPSTPTPQSPNLYTDIYKAEYLQYTDKYRAAIAEYEQALKKLPRSPTDTKVMNVSFPTFLKYHIAFCYAKLAEANRDVSLYVKAETAARESYKTAILPSDQADALYLWGYILFKQQRYEEARAKYEEIIERFLQAGVGSDQFLKEVLYALGKAYFEFGDEVNARRIFSQLEARIQTIIQGGDSDFHTEETMYALGKAYLTLGDKAAARRVFAHLLELIKIELQDTFIGYGADIFYEETLYALGKMYLTLGDEAAALGKRYLALSDQTTARQAFVQLEARIEVNLQDGHSSAEDDLYELGKAYLELGDEFAARRVFAKLRVNFPKSSYKAEMERLLHK